MPNENLENSIQRLGITEPEASEPTYQESWERVARRCDSFQEMQAAYEDRLLNETGKRLLRDYRPNLEKI